MTTHKVLERRVRARATKTGESYTAARAQVLRKADPPEPAAPDTLAISGVSDTAMIRGSGKPLGEWLRLLDAWRADQRKHAEIARWIVAEHGVPGWWAQFAKGEGKTQVSLSHEKLPDGDSAERLKVMWRERLAALKAVLESP